MTDNERDDIELETAADEAIMRLIVGGALESDVAPLSRLLGNHRALRMIAAVYQLSPEALRKRLLERTMNLGGPVE